MADKREIHSAVQILGTTTEDGKYRRGRTISDPDELEEVLTPEMRKRLTEKGAISGFALAKEGQSEGNKPSASKGSAKK